MSSVPRCRLRELGISIGNLSPGQYNAITDVPGVRVGHATLISGEGPLRPGYSPVRTGVTVILPHSGDLFHQKVRAAVHTLNGFGKAVGFEQVRELGVIEAPIALTNTLNVGLVLDAVVQYAIRQSPEIGIHTSTVNVVVGETNDGYLNDLQGRHVRAQHVWSAIECAVDGLVLEGAVGAGTGTCCMGWKGGIGTASRVLPGGSGGFTMGALVQSNFGSAGRLMVCGMPIGELLKPPTEQPVSAPENGSIMIILATDAPLSERQLGRLCRRAAIGLAHVGSRLEHSSGDFVIAFTTANPIQHAPTALTAQQVAVVDEPHLLPLLFQAVIESVEEAVLNSLCCADTMVGRDGHIAYGLPLDQLVRLWAELKSTLSPALRCSSSL